MEHVAHIVVRISHYYMIVSNNDNYALRQKPINMIIEEKWTIMDSKGNQKMTNTRKQNKKSDQ